MSGLEIIGLILLAAFIVGAVCWPGVLLLRDLRREARGLDGLARSLRRIRDEERELDPTAPSVLRLLAKDD